eukprot:TRINITY_DN10818_c0_g1_i1.p1 TRINITY_DN10818_c0_g1~~TRINITY_DN10818_c0_g1_i1.p1  ORF type:complete len:402 (-),score=77.89 TRINITY_DN10818_c0_g1_i1:50-1255(-)
MFERVTLLKQIEEIRTELNGALYQNDAACRVVARLLKERDAIRQEIEQLKKESGIAGPTREDKLPGLDNETKAKITQKHQELSTLRKQKVPPPTLAAETIKGYKEKFSMPPHQAGRGVLTLDIHPSYQELIVTGGADKCVVLIDYVYGKKLATLTGHKKQVNSVLFHPVEDVIITGASDSLVLVWKANAPQKSSYAIQHEFSEHSGEVVQCSLHCTQEYVVSASRDSSWAFHSLVSGKTLLKVPEPEKSPLTCAMLHPDGGILATGTDSHQIRIWDIRSQKNVANFPGHTDAITDLCFSENGFSLASSGKDNILKLWDLRGPKNTDSLRMDAAVRKLRYDDSGKYLGVATGTEIRIFTGKRLEHIHTFDGHSAVVTDIKFGKDASFIASTSMDRYLKLWGH